jgi:hypothetical protein
MAQPFIPCPHGVQIAVVHEFLNRQFTNVVNLDYGSVPTEAAMEDIAGSAITTYGYNMLPVYSTNVRLVSITARSLASQEAPLAVALSGAGAIGELNFGSEVGSSAQALCLTLRTAVPGKSGRGRVFIGCVKPRADLNYADEAWAASVRLAFEGWMGDMLTAGIGHLSVLSKYHNGVARTEGLLRHVTTVDLRNTRIDSQLRRAPKD